jgi:hypothetical protein
MLLSLILQPIGGLVHAVIAYLILHYYGPYAQAQYYIAKINFDLLAAIGTLGLPQALFAELFVHKSKASSLRGPIIAYFSLLTFIIVLSVQLTYGPFLSDSIEISKPLLIAVMLLCGLIGTARPFLLLTQSKYLFDIAAFLPTGAFSCSYFLAMALGGRGSLAHELNWYIFISICFLFAAFSLPGLRLAKSFRGLINSGKRNTKSLMVISNPNTLLPILARLSKNSVYPFAQAMASLLLVKCYLNFANTRLGLLQVSYLGNAFTIYAILLAPISYLSPKLQLGMIRARENSHSFSHSKFLNHLNNPPSLRALSIPIATVVCLASLSVYAMQYLGLNQQLIAVIAIPVFAVVLSSIRSLLLVHANSHGNLKISCLSEVAKLFMSASTLLLIGQLSAGDVAGSAIIFLLIIICFLFQEGLATLALSYFTEKYRPSAL